jgi:hypothetical protein
VGLGEALRALWYQNKARVTLAEVSGSSFGPTIKDQLDEERARKNSLEARGIGIVTSSGALATLLFGLVAFTRGTNNQLHWNIGTPARVALLVGVGLFAVAALLGLAANYPGDYREAAVDRLENRVEPGEWHKPDPVDAARRDARINVIAIKAARLVNGKKARAVRWGIAAEAAATAAVALAVAFEILSI